MDLVAVVVVQNLALVGSTAVEMADVWRRGLSVTGSQTVLTNQMRQHVLAVFQVSHKWLDLMGAF